MEIMSDFIIAGDIDNWMDLRDKFIEFLQICDSEAKLNRFIQGIFMSICPTPESINDIRESIGIKKFTKKQLKELEKMYKEKKKQKK